MRTQTNARTIAASVVATLAVAFFTPALHAFTIATFADPALDASEYLFRIDLNTDTIMGAWPDANDGLTLEVPFAGQVYPNAFFEMTDLSYTGGVAGGPTGPGVVRFYQDGDNPLTAIPVVTVSFASANVAVQGLYGDNIYDLHADNDVVIIVNTLTGPVVLTHQASFAFSFANQTPLPPPGAGYVATAAFTSSAAAIPEPATMVVLLAGAVPLLLARRARRS